MISVDAQAEKVNALADDLGADKADAHVGSVADPGLVQGMVANTVTKNDAIHGLVNTAGIVRAGMINKMHTDTW